MKVPEDKEEKAWGTGSPSQFAVSTIASSPSPAVSKGPRIKREKRVREGADRGPAFKKQGDVLPQLPRSDQALGC